MKIAVLGTGQMGKALGTLLAEAGHTVLFGSRNQEKARTAASLAGDRASHGSLEEAAAFGQVLIYTIRDVPPTEIVTDPSVFDGKIVIDLNNTDIPADYQYQYQGPSLAERLQQAIPKAHVVQAFNTIPQPVFEYSTAERRHHGISVFVAGDDDKARQTVAALAQELGFNPVDLGPLRRSIFAQQLADVLRYLLIGQGLGPFYTLSTQDLPKLENRRFV